MHPLQLHIPITKVDTEKRLVYGVAAAEVPDRQDEILDYESSKPFFESWSDSVQKDSKGKSKFNVREMHTLSAVGAGQQLHFNDNAKQVEVCAKIVDDDAWKKVQAGVYTGFSVGGSYERTWKDPASGLTRYTANPNEVSIVDRPAVPTATFTLVKADGSTEVRTFLKTETEPYGDVTYADPGYQSDKKKRYPLDTEEHVRAAWNYSHQERNASEYSSEQVAHIRSAIERAWKEKIDPDGPPSAESKKSTTDSIHRDELAALQTRFTELSAALNDLKKVFTGEQQMSTDFEKRMKSAAEHLQAAIAAHGKTADCMGKCMKAINGSAVDEGNAQEADAGKAKDQSEPSGFNVNWGKADKADTLTKAEITQLVTEGVNKGITSLVDALTAKSEPEDKGIVRGGGAGESSLSKAQDTGATANNKAKEDDLPPAPGTQYGASQFRKVAQAIKPATQIPDNVAAAIAMAANRR